MLDFELAALYDVHTKVLNQAVKRNNDRFPEDFMFQLTLEEWQELKSKISDSSWSQNVTSSSMTEVTRSQNVTSSRKFRGEKYMPYAFTEQGVAMLSGVLKSQKAVQVNIFIMRAFVLLRRFALTHEELAQKIAELEDKYDNVHEILSQLLLTKEQQEDWEKRERIGFKK